MEKQSEHTIRQKTMMKLGCQRYGANSDAVLQYYARYGVQHIAATATPWTVENITKMRQRAESYGISIEAAHIPTLNLPFESADQRDQTIHQMCDIIRSGADGGYSVLLYNMRIPSDIPMRTEPVSGRGGVRLSAWELAKVDSGPQETEPGSSEKMWEEMTDFLERVVPVAEACQVRLACHPPDPPLPAGFRGVTHVLATVSGLKRFISIAESDYHGLHFCQGTVSEMLEKPSEEIYDVIRYFGSRKKIFNVHFRNIRGGRNQFCETYPDEGDVDMLKAMRVYKEVGYDGMVMPDHLPNHPDDPEQRESFAFAYGYIRALIQAVAAED